ncbi:MAG: hypothetical protein JSU86_17805 [Phycisphaerales bacterium]|nr:MAG: hypothetical protein JSU86_17805 [Phycisphaerales bacterium]
MAQPDMSDGIENGGGREMRRRHWIILAILAVVEIASALYLAWLNPVQGYDENWYLISSHRIAGATALPYAHHRPPVFPILLALFGDYNRLVPGIAHIGSAALTFIILRRLVTLRLAISGVVVFMASYQLRTYNVLLLTEMTTIFLLLLATYCFLVHRPFLLGVVATLLVMTHWSMATVGLVVSAVYIMRCRWRPCGMFVAGASLAATPFLIVSAAAYGNPLAPALANFAVQSGGTNDWWFYVREFPLLSLPLIIGGLAAGGWVIANRRNWRNLPWYDFCVLLLGIIVARVMLLHVVGPKGVRFLVPLIPMLLLLTLLMLRHYGQGIPRLQWAALAILLISVLPDRQWVYYIHDLARNPVKQIADLKDTLATFASDQAVYTDLNDLAVMGRTGHPAVAVTGPGSWHHQLYNRPACTRGEIPEGVLYLTWDPGPLEVIAAASPARHRPLSLVRWRTGGQPHAGASVLSSTAATSEAESTPH